MTGFNVDDELVRKLAALLDDTGLTEIEYAKGEESIRVSRGTTAAPPGPAAISATAVAAASPAPSSAAGSHPGAVTAPMVGTVYLAPEPGSAPFVSLGDMVIEGQTLLLIEAMKTYNPVRATRAGKVVRILVMDTAPVEYGEELIILE
ncbi:MAG: acetyl-CoA carboxylase biotin carboxyl carrier protein subunit [Pseudomonadota bacterium]|nr:acetyl-CoA carboxylase biotin carboxyl carrier protein subunit [Pseudomonadota bacterium]